MSLIWLRQKLLKAKAIDPNLKFKLLDFKYDEEIPNRLRESLMSVTFDNQQQIGYFRLPESDAEEKWEAATECADGCNHEGCLMKTSTTEEIYIATKRVSSSRTISLFPNILSSMSIIETSDFDRESLLSVTYLAPLRNESVIIHWKVKCIYGIRGFRIHVDGKLASTVYSSERSSELLHNVSMKIPHNFTISIIPNELVTLASRTTAFFEPVTYFFHP